MSRSKKAAGSKSMPDVAHPGTTAPSDTSKPIINQRPIMKDPMVVEDNEPDDKAKKPLPKKTSETKITPPEKPAEDETKPDDEATEPAPKEPETAESETPADEKADDAGKKQSPKAEKDKDTATETAQDAKLQQLIDSKKYFLPLNAVEHRRSKRVAIVGFVLALLLALAWVNIALDAGLINLGDIKPVTHFFSS